MRTITIAAPKGGSGKTTITLLLAVQAFSWPQGAIFDMNAEQGNIGQWHVSRGEVPGPDVIAVENLARDAKIPRPQRVRLPLRRYAARLG